MGKVHSSTTTEGADAVDMGNRGVRGLARDAAIWTPASGEPKHRRLIMTHTVGLDVSQRTTAICVVMRPVGAPGGTCAPRGLT